MTREITCDNEETGCTMAGHIEVVKDRVLIGTPITYTITPYVEDKKWGFPITSVLEENLLQAVAAAEKDVRRELKRRLANSSSAEEALKNKGYGGF